MKGTRYVDGLYLTQDFFNRTEQNKSESIKERFGTFSGTTGWGIVGPSTKLTLSVPSTNYISISSGEGYTQSNVDDSSPEHGSSGERIYLPNGLSNTHHSPTLIGQKNHIYLMYIEIHKERKTDETGAAFYTKKEDNYIVVQLSDAQKSGYPTSFDTTGLLSVVEMPITHSAITGLTDSELTDTFGTNKWRLKTVNGVPYTLVVDVTLSKYNSIYLGAINSDTSIDTSERKYFFITNDILNVESALIGAHRGTEHSNGIISSNPYGASLKCVIDSNVVPDTVIVSDLASGDTAFIGENKLEQGELSDSQRSLAVNSTNFTSGTTDYYIYLWYDAVNGLFKIVAKSTATVIPAVDLPYYMLLCKVYADPGNGNASAFNGDARFDTNSASNPVADLRKFGTMDLDKLSNEAKIEVSDDNLIANGNFEVGSIGYSPIGWYSTGTLVDTSLGGNYSLQLDAGEFALSDPIPYNKLNTYNIRASVKSVSGSPTLSIGVRGYTGKEYLDTNISDTLGVGYYPVAVSSPYPINGVSVGATWSIKEADFSTGWSFGTLGTTIDSIKYIRLVVKANTAGVYLDSIKLVDKNGVTSSAAELNKVDGFTGTAANLNELVGGGATSLHSHASTAYIYGFSSSVEFTTVGTFPWIVPAGIYRFFAAVWGGGGGGGKNKFGGGAGGGGGFAAGIFETTPSTNYGVTVGSYGVGSTVNGVGGSTGGSSGISGILAGFGGFGGSGDAYGAGGTGGGGSVIGSTNYVYRTFIFNSTVPLLQGGLFNYTIRFGGTGEAGNGEFYEGYGGGAGGLAGSGSTPTGGSGTISDKVLAELLEYFGYSYSGGNGGSGGGDGLGSVGSFPGGGGSSGDRYTNGFDGAKGRVIIIY